jgi:hypothetical protein
MKIEPRSEPSSANRNSPAGSLSLIDVLSQQIAIRPERKTVHVPN